MPCVRCPFTDLFFCLFVCSLVDQQELVVLSWQRVPTRRRVCMGRQVCAMYVCVYEHLWWNMVNNNNSNN